MRKKSKQVLSVLLGAALLIPAGWMAPAAKAATSELEVAKTVYHETFKDGAGKAGKAGDANTKMEVVSGKIFDGNEKGNALYLSGRTADWHGIDFGLSNIGLEKGKTYTVTAVVYVDPEVIVPEKAQAAFQTVDSYTNDAAVNYEAGKSVTLHKNITWDSDKDKALRIKSNTEGTEVPFYLREILITGEAASDGEEKPRDPALPFTTITFEDQKTGGFEGRSGKETLTITKEENHSKDGSYALKVEGRSDSWHGPSLRVEKYVDKGSEYKVSAWVKLIEPASAQLDLSTQIGQTSPNYPSLSAKTVNASDGWVKLEGSYRYNSVSDEFLSIYVQSSNKTASFYIDDISFEKTGSGPIAIQKDLIPVKNKYQNDFLIGNAISSEDLEGVRLDLLKMHHNVVTAGNAMKPDALQPTKGTFTFDAADAMVNKVLAEGMQMHGHVLVWHQQSPDWMNTTKDAEGKTIPLKREEALLNLKTHIRTVVEHFGNRVISWDVVNEAMNDNPSNPSDWQGALRKSPWYNAIGPDYLEQAFLAAREVLDEHPDWDVKLYYNDYNDDNQNKAQAIYSMVKDLNDSYALKHPGKRLVDGVGMQAHYNINTNPENVKLSLEKFISLGVEVSITELDIMAGSEFQLSEKLANAQGYLYAQLFDIYKAHAANIARVTFWGLDDNTSWRAENNPLLFDKNLQAKPAYYAVIDSAKFLEEHQPDLTHANQSTAAYATPVIDGTVDAAWSKAVELPINRYQTAWQGATGVAKTLWDEQNLYVLIQVSDAQLDKSNVNAWEQDSVEIFLDENNAKTSFYQDDDGQFRINFDNEASFSPASLSEGFESATKVSGTNYTVEVKIPFKKVTVSNDKKIGFDVQINDAKEGVRQSVAAWNDTTGNGYQDTSIYGILTLTGKPGAVTDSGSSSSSPQTGTVESKDGVVTIKLEVKTEGGLAKAVISGDNFKKALEKAAPGANGKKQIVIELPKQASGASYDVQLPAQSLKGQDNFVLVLKTGTATIEIPGSMLSNVTAITDPVSIRVSQPATDKLEAAARNVIGSHPVIEFNLISGGKVVAWNNPDAPVAVSIPYTPSAEEISRTDLLVVKRLDGNGVLASIPNGRFTKASGSIVFSATQSGIYAVADIPVNFGDMGNLSWAKEAVAAMAARDIIQGTSENSFSPAADIKRADFIALLVRALELKGTGKDSASFGDVQTGAYYSSEVAVAKQLGIVFGYGDNSFKPNLSISRQDMMVIAARALAAAGKQAQGSGTLNAYSDADQVSGYAKDSLAALVKYGIVSGKDGKLALQDTLTRAEAAVILYRIWNL